MWDFCSENRTGNARSVLDVWFPGAFCIGKSVIDDVESAVTCALTVAVGWQFVTFCGVIIKFWNRVELGYRKALYFLFLVL